MSDNEPDLRALLEAATPGPWEPYVLGSEGYEVRGPRSDRPLSRQRRIARVGYNDWDGDKADAALIAALRNEAAALLDDRDRLRALEAGVEAVVKQAESGADAWGACSHEWVRIHQLRALLATRPDDAGVTEVGS